MWLAPGFLLAGMVAAGCTGDDEVAPPTAPSSPSSTRGSSEVLSSGPVATMPPPDEPTSEYEHTVSQQLGVSSQDRARVQERLEWLQGRYAAETWSVFTSVNADGTGPSNPRVWMRGPEGSVVCSGSGSVEWTVVGPDGFAPHELRCEMPSPDGGGAGEGATTPSARIPALAAPDAPGVGFPETFTVAATPETAAWVGVHTVLTDHAPAAALVDERGAALADLGGASPLGSDRVVIEADGSGAGNWIDVGVSGESGRTYAITASCRGEGTFQLIIGVDDSRHQTVDVECGDGGPVTDEVTFHGPEDARTVLVAGDQQTRGVLAFEISPTTS